jgi:hypothetical protein
VGREKINADSQLIGLKFRAEHFNQLWSEHAGAGNSGDSN